MKNENFDWAIEHVLDAEGGYTKDNLDRGNWTGGVIGRGELKGTKFGISAASFPDKDIEGLTLEEAKDIYKEVYWNRLKCYEFDSLLALYLLDFGVNSGVHKAAITLQEILKVTPDGIIGKDTLKAYTLFNSKSSLRYVYLSSRLDYIIQLKTFSRFGRSWVRRISQLLSLDPTLD